MCDNIQVPKIDAIEQTGIETALNITLRFDASVFGDVEIGDVLSSFAEFFQLSKYYFYPAQPPAYIQGSFWVSILALTHVVQQPEDFFDGKYMDDIAQSCFALYPWNGVMQYAKLDTLAVNFTLVQHCPNNDYSATCPTMSPSPTSAPFQGTPIDKVDFCTHAPAFHGDFFVNLIICVNIVNLV